MEEPRTKKTKDGEQGVGERRRGSCLMNLEPSPARLHSNVRQT